MDYREEKDTLGVIRVPKTAYWGAQTERSRQHFHIGSPASMPIEIIHALALVKKCAARANHTLGILSYKKAQLITKACDEILAGKLDQQFPLVVWQTGSGTQTNMNVNEVIVNRVQVLAGGKLADKDKVLHPNDDVNMSQSSNDVFPTAMHIAVYIKAMQYTIPSLTMLQKSLHKFSRTYVKVIKLGRTHMMDATPITLGQEFSGYVQQLERGIDHLHKASQHLLELAIGGTAVGTGLNAPKGFRETVIRELRKETSFRFVKAKNPFEALASHDALVLVSSAIKNVAVSLNKIASDIRLMASGPRGGISELVLPANEPGSSIMPGKINPTQCEAMTMVCAQVIGNDAAITIGGMSGQFELNVYKPLIVKNVLESLQLLGDASQSFTTYCVDELKPNVQQIEKHLHNSLMLVTALNPHIGYEKSALIAKKAYTEGVSIQESAIKLGFVTREKFKKYVNPKKMV